MFSCFCQKAEDSETWHVHLQGIISVEQSEWFEDHLPNTLSGAQRVYFDFRKITHIDSDGVALLLKLLHVLKDQGTQFCCENVENLPMLSMLIMRLPQLIGVSIFEKLPSNDHDLA